MSSEVKPCPWCPAEDSIPIVDFVPGAEAIAGHCSNCGARGPVILVIRTNAEHAKEQAIALWNKRAGEKTDPVSRDYGRPEEDEAWKDL